MDASRPQPDSELVAAALAGDNEAFRHLIQRYEKRTFWLARGMLRNDEDARDVAQDAFLRVHRSLAKFDQALKFEHWLKRIVINLCIDSLRKRKRRSSVDLESVAEVEGRPRGPDVLEASELKGRVAATLDQLPPVYRAVMVLRDLQGVDAKKAAEITGVTHGTLRWRHHRARQLFREAWEFAYGRGVAFALGSS